MRFIPEPRTQRPRPLGRFPRTSFPRRRHSRSVGSISPGPVISALLADWPPEKLKEAKESGSLLEASEVANVVTFMLTRPRGMTIRDVVMLPTNFDL
jgi:ribitol 2-dehydrogenase